MAPPSDTPDDPVPDDGDPSTADPGDEAPGDGDGGDLRVRELIDAATRAELERWFGLPSFQQVEEQPRPKAAEDPELIARREQRARALAAVDPVWLAAHHERFEVRTESLLKFRALISVVIDPDMALFDHGMVDRAITLAEPREVDIPEPLREDMRDCAPQALLRDLHRPELEFEKQFEIVDIAAEQRLDVVAAVAEAMATNWKLPVIEGSPLKDALTEFGEMRATRWRDTLDALATLPNRRVSE